MELHKQRMAPRLDKFRDQDLNVNGVPVDCLVDNSMSVEVGEASL